jgi:hypothetical protein
MVRDSGELHKRVHGAPASTAESSCGCHRSAPSSHEFLAAPASGTSRHGTGKLSPKESTAIADMFFNAWGRMQFTDSAQFPKSINTTLV